MALDAGCADSRDRAVAARSRIVLSQVCRVFTSVHIDVHAEIGPGFVIHSVYAINLGKTKIGRNFTIATGCLISHACRGIGDDVYFGPGAKLVGDAKIGNNVTVAANSLVLTDVKDNMMIMGVPARIKLPGGRPQKISEEDSSRHGAGEGMPAAQAPSKQRRARRAFAGNA